MTPDDPRLPLNRSHLRWAAARRAERSQLRDADVQRVITELVETGEFDVLLTTDPRFEDEVMRLRSVAVQRLIDEGRDPDAVDVVNGYVANDLWTRFPLVSPDYQAKADRMHERWGLERRLPEVFDDETFGRAHHGASDSAPDVPQWLVLRWFERHPMVGLTTYVHDQHPGARFHEPGPDRRWLAIRDDGSFVELDIGATHPSFVRTEFLSDTRELAIAYDAWQATRSERDYQFGMQIGHMGYDPMPTVRRRSRRTRG